LAGPYRITHIKPVDDLAVAAPAGETLPPPFQSYLDRLMRMIPAEVIALYLVGAGFIPSGERIVLAVWSVICLVGLIVLRADGSRDEQTGRGPQWSSVAISSVAFVIWLYSLGGPFVAFDLHVPYIGSLLVLAWTFFLPILYKGELIGAEGRS
jgi:hypothetical protein